jgi:hypothetical protein
MSDVGISIAARAARPVAGPAALLCAALLLSAPAPAQEEGPRPELDGPEAAAAILGLLTDGAPARLELPVVAPAEEDGSKWVRALARHPEWPVLMPYAARVAFDCDPEVSRAGEPACWRLVEGEALPVPAPGPAAAATDAPAGLDAFLDAGAEAER